MDQSEVDECIGTGTLLDAEHPELVWDLRITNMGRPEVYTYFFQKCQELLQGKIETAVDDMRHNNIDSDGESVVHLAVAMSAKDLHEQVEESPKGTPIPSVQWLRL